MRVGGLGRVLFAVGLIGLGVNGVISRDFASFWQPVPASVPGRELIALASGIILFLVGFGLLVERAAPIPARVLFVYTLLWFLLKVPPLVAAPLVEVNWLGSGELAVIVAAAWVLFATLGKSRPNFATGERGVRVARFVFGLALPAIGLSHFVYTTESLAYVPVWLPMHLAWVYLAGAGHIAAGLGVLFGVLPRLAAMLEAWMISAFTLLAWVPMVVATPTTHQSWTGFLMSWTIGAAAWVVADSYSGTPWFTRSRYTTR